LVQPGNSDVINRSGGNLAGVTITAAERLNTYEVLNTKSLVLMKDSIEKMKEVFLKK
jgi:ribosomal protein L4